MGAAEAEAERRQSGRLRRYSLASLSDLLDWARLIHPRSRWLYSMHFSVEMHCLLLHMDMEVSDHCLIFSGFRLLSLLPPSPHCTPV